MVNIATPELARDTSNGSWHYRPHLDPAGIDAMNTIAILGCYWVLSSIFTLFQSVISWRRRLAVFLLVVGMILMLFAVLKLVSTHC